MEVKEYNMKLKISKEMFHDDEKMYGIYSCIPVDYTREIVLNRFNNFSLKGQTRKLLKGESYVVKFSGPHANTNPMYDDYYQIVEVEPEKLDTVDQQDKFLQAILTESQFNSLKDAYPDPHLIVDLILADKIDTSRTKGIKKKSLEKIKFNVEQNASVSILIAKLNTLNLSTSSINKLLVHFKTSEKVIQAIDKDIYSLCEVPQFGFTTVDRSAIARGDNPTNKNRITACFTYLLKKDNQDGHTWSLKEGLIEGAVTLLQINPVLVKDHLDSLGKSGDIYLDEDKVAASRIRKQELSIRDHLWRIHSAYIAPSKTRIESRIEKVEDEQGFKFTEQQKSAIINSSQNGVSIINGVAGSGKSSIVKGLLDVLGIGDEYMTCALSGKAAAVLSERGIQSSTIHRMLKYDGQGFAFNHEIPLEYPVVVVDELSMVDTSLFLSVVQAIKTGNKLVLVGDSAQLSSIGTGDILRDLLDSKTFPAYELTQVHRQATKSGVLEMANEVRRGENIVTYNSSGKVSYGETDVQTVITYTKDNNNSIFHDVLKIAQSYSKKIECDEDLLEFQVLVSNRESGALNAMKMNVELQKIFNDNSKPFISRGGYDYRSGDKVIAVGNSYDLASYESVEEYLETVIAQALVVDEEDDNQQGGDTDVFNGSMGIIKAIHTDTKMVFVEFEGIEGLIPYSQTNLDKLSLGYAITIHRSQGSSFSDLLVAVDFSSYMLLNRKLIYTALTRSSGRGILLAENNALFQAIQNEASSRRTFLKDLLLKSIQ